MANATKSPSVNECWFCREHEDGDTLYSYASWDGGIAFDYVNNIRFCPICGERLKTYEEKRKAWRSVSNDTD